jgi:hypothetical protein
MEEEWSWADHQVANVLDALWYEADSPGVELPPGVKATDFLRAAYGHLREGNDGVCLIDAISNAKRALDRRIHELLFVFGLAGKAQGWPMPKKLDLLEYLRLPAPRILRRLNTFRNIAEHDLKPPNADAVADFVDAVSLFLESTWWYIRSFADEVTYYPDPDAYNVYWHMSFDRDQSQFTIRTYFFDDHTEDEDEAGTLSLDDSHYLPYLRGYLALLSDRVLMDCGWGGSGSTDYFFPL